MRRGVELLRKQNVFLIDGLLKIALAEAEARAGNLDRARSLTATMKLLAGIARPLSASLMLASHRLRER
jgi:hypothetical protein